MGKRRRMICRLCLQKCVDFKAVEACVKDVLDMLLLNINLAISKEPIMCTNCAAMLMRCFDFKTICFYTRDCIASLLHDEKISKLDLRKLYISKHENVAIPDDHSICGFCLGLAKKCTAVSLDNDEKDATLDKLIKKYLPELDLNIIEEPLICATCYESFKTCIHFVTSCLIVEEQVMEYRKLMGVDIIEISDVLQLTCRDVLKVEEDGNTIDVNSTEGVDMRNADRHKNDDFVCMEDQKILLNGDVEIKTEHDFDSILKKEEDSNAIDIISTEEKFFVDVRNADEHKNDSFVCMEEQKRLLKEEVEIKTEQQDLDSISKVEEDSDAIDVISTEGKFFVDMRNANEHKNGSSVYMEEQKLLPDENVEIKTEQHDFDRYPDGVVSPQPITIKSDERKKCLVSNEQKEAHNMSDAIMHQCDLCSYRTEYLEHFEKHRKIHGDLKEIKMYHCNCCSYKTKYKKQFKSHTVEHHNSSEVSKACPYRCNSCQFRAKYYRSLRNHMITHTDVSETVMYQCDSCPFKTKYKRSLQNHIMITHADISETTMYQCESCSFRTKYRLSLQAHMITHRDISETTMYECDSCLFRTKYKRSLRCHMITHTDVSEVTMYQCYSCSFKTKHKNNLRGHMLQHKNPLEVTMHRCKSCQYQTEHENQLKRHFLIHKGPSEINPNQCDASSVFTDQKYILQKHVITHQLPSKPTFYQCSSCSFKTNHKQSLDVHMSSHKDPLEVTMYQCTSCPYRTKHKRNLKQHFVIHKRPSEVTIYRCDSCSFHTNYKGNLQRHMATHKRLRSANVPV